MDSWSFSWGVLLGVLLGWGFKVWMIAALIKLAHHVQALVDLSEKYMDRCLELEVEISNLKEKYESPKPEFNPENQSKMEKALDKIRKRIQDSHGVPPPDPGPLLDPEFNKLPKVDNSKVSFPRLFTLTLTFKRIKKFWKDSLK